MKKCAIFLLALLDITLRVSAYGGKMFNSWRQPMKKYDFKWKAVPAKTEDGFNLMLFHIEGNASGAYPARRPPVLIMPGLFDDAGRWLALQSSNPDEENILPFFLQLAEAGYDVWVGNPRGTEFSQEHKVFRPNDPDFWNFSFEKMGQYDVPTLVRRVKAMTGMRKIFYIGRGQGADAMFYALADPNCSIKADLHKFVALAPCVAERDPAHPNESYFEEGLYKFPEIGVTSFYGPNWLSDLAKICETFSKEVCDEWSADQAIKRQPTPVKNLIHRFQNGFQNRVQKFAPNYKSGQKQTDLVDINSISGVRIAMFVPENDDYCPFEQIQGVATEATIKMPGIGHYHFQTAKDEGFVKELIAQLWIAPGDEEPAFSDEL